MALSIKDHIRNVPDFPKPGILFYDIGTLLAHGPAWQQAVDQMAGLAQPLAPSLLLAIESRGFLIGAPLADRLGVGVAMARKKGKLPGQTLAHTYTLEYGSDTLEVQPDLLSASPRVLVVDDLLATGGTTKAAITLARQAGATVIGALFLIELAFLNGRANLDVPTQSLLTYNE